MTQPGQGDHLGTARRSTPAIAPEVAAQIVARRAAREQVPVIGRGLHLTLLEVREVLRGAEPACPAR